MYDAHTRHVTVAHIRSESGDHDLFTADGWLNGDEIARMVYEESPDWWMDPEYVHIEQIEQIRFVS